MGSRSRYHRDQLTPSEWLLPLCSSGLDEDSDGFTVEEALTQASALATLGFGVLAGAR